MHKNKNEARGNFVIYAIELFGRIFKIGKANSDRITKSSGLPTRIHQQERKLNEQHGFGAADSTILEKLQDVST